jgi:hypothetical protein
MSELCQCELQPGQRKLDCPRHDCVKYARLVQLCNAGARGERIGVRYWRAWEEGRGPGQVPREPPHNHPIDTMIRAHCLPCAQYPCLNANCRNDHRDRLRAGQPCPLGQFRLVPIYGITCQRKTICMRCPEYVTDRCGMMTAEAYSAALVNLAAQCPRDQWYARWQEVGDVVRPTSQRLVITVASTARFQRLLSITRPTFLRYAEHCRAEYVELTDPTQNWGPLEKFRVHRFAQEYAQTLFVDADVIITAQAPDLFARYPRGVAMHDDLPELRVTNWIAAERQALLATQGWTVRDPDCLFNSGVVLTSRDCADVWQPPRAPFFPTHCAEQFFVEHQALELGEIQRLPTSFNTQWWMPRFWSLVPSAHIIHLANCAADKQLALAERFLRLDGHYS